MPDKQAEAVIKLMAQQGEDLATKADITALQTEMVALRSDIKSDIAELKVSILLALFGVLGLMIAAIKLL